MGNINLFIWPCRTIWKPFRNEWKQNRKVQGSTRISNIRVMQLVESPFGQVFLECLYPRQQTMFLLIQQRGTYKLNDKEHRLVELAAEHPPNHCPGLLMTYQ